MELRTIVRIKSNVVKPAVIGEVWGRTLNGESLIDVYDRKTHRWYNNLRLDHVDIIERPQIQVENTL